MSNNRYYCRINGRIYNLEKIQNVIDKNPQNPNYGEIFILAVEEYKLPESIMLDEVIKFNNNEIPADYNECLERMREYNSRSHSNTPTIKCPTCGSTRVKRISTTSKVVGATMFGLFSKTARSQFECLSCKYKW